MVATPLRYATPCLYILPILLTLPGLVSGIIPRLIWYSIIAFLSLVRLLFDHVQPGHPIRSINNVKIDFNPIHLSPKQSNQSISDDKKYRLTDSQFKYYFKRMEYSYQVLVIMLIIMIFIYYQESIVIQNVFFLSLYVEYLNKTVMNISYIIEAKRRLGEDFNHVSLDNNSLVKIYKDCQILQVMTVYTVGYYYLDMAGTSTVYYTHLNIQLDPYIVIYGFYSRLCFIAFQQYVVLCVVSFMGAIEQHIKNQLDYNNKNWNELKVNNQNKNMMQQDDMNSARNNNNNNNNNNNKGHRNNNDNDDNKNEESKQAQRIVEQKATAGAANQLANFIDNRADWMMNPPKKKRGDEEKNNTNNQNDTSNNGAGFWKKNQWYIKMYFVIFSAALSLAGLILEIVINEDVFDFNIFLNALIFAQLCSIIIFIVTVAIINYRFCKHVTLRETAAIPVEFYYCSTACCAYRQSVELAFAFWHQCSKLKIPRQNDHFSRVNSFPRDYNYDYDLVVGMSSISDDNYEYNNDKLKISVEDELAMQYETHINTLNTNERIINCFAFWSCCGACMTYHFYPKDTSKRVITMLNVALLFLQLLLSYDSSQNKQDILSIVSKIAYLITNVSLYVSIFGFHLLRACANPQSQVTMIGKLNTLGIKNAKLYLMFKLCLQILVVVTDLYLFMLILIDEYPIYYQIIHKFWIFPLYLVINEMSQFSLNFDYTLTMTMFAQNGKTGNETGISVRNKVATLTFYESIMELVYLLIVGCLFAAVSEIYIINEKKFDVDEIASYVPYLSILLYCAVLCVSVAIISVGKTENVEEIEIADIVANYRASEGKDGVKNTAKDNTKPNHKRVVMINEQTGITFQQMQANSKAMKVNNTMPSRLQYNSNNLSNAGIKENEKGIRNQTGKKQQLNLEIELNF